MHIWEPSSCFRQLLVRVVNHTLLLTWSVSRFSTKYQFSEVKPSHTHFSEPGSLFSAVTRASNMECVTILYKKVTSVRSDSHSRTFENLRFFPWHLFVRVVNYTLFLIHSVSRFSAQFQFSEVKPSHKHIWEPGSLSRQLLLCVENHTLLIIQSVSRFSTKYQFSEVKPSHKHIWEPPSLFSVVTHARRKSHTTPEGVCHNSLQNISSVRSNPHTHTLLSTTESFSDVSRARSKSHTTPDTECGTILYKILVHWVSDKRTFQNLRVLLRQILMHVVNHTLLLIRSVSRLSTNVTSVY